MLGAFGAHGLAEQLSAQALATWDTAVLYHLVHSLALVLTGALEREGSDRLRSIAGWAFAVGVLLFSGSLYLLALGGPTVLGPVTPLGGAAFIVGWLLLAAAEFRGQSS